VCDHAQIDQLRLDDLGIRPLAARQHELREDGSLTRLRDVSLPCDGAWAEEQALFEAWIATRRAA
jgi:hypothetical protein